MDKSIIAQSAGKDAAVVVSALVSNGLVANAEEVGDLFSVVRKGMFEDALALAGGEPEERAANTSAPASNGGARRGFGGGARRANDAGAGVSLKFGEHQGKTIQQVFEEDSSYITWLAKSSNNDFIRGKANEFLAANAPELLAA